jgi:hypothetical protein
MHRKVDFVSLNVLRLKEGSVGLRDMTVNCWCSFQRARRIGLAVDAESARGELDAEKPVGRRDPSCQSSQSEYVGDCK